MREAIARGFPFGDPQFFPSMQVPEAYRSLARPSSALEPSHSPAGTVASLMDVTLVTRITVGSSGRLDRTYIRCHYALVDATAFDPSHPRLRGMVHRSCVAQPSAVLHLRRAVRRRWAGMDPLGFEPRASSLQRRCSTAELRARSLGGTRGECVSVSVSLGGS